MQQLKNKLTCTAPTDNNNNLPCVSHFEGVTCDGQINQNASTSSIIQYPRALSPTTGWFQQVSAINNYMKRASIFHDRSRDTLKKTKKQAVHAKATWYSYG
mmetsp:Transcript_89595/g.141412  ORF Transcript_89595/g.141412 Transcript_89595/m.141412 type:complete len:101 (+) Transcript_89595:155-457(+)